MITDSLEVKIKVDDKEFNRALGDVEKRLSGIDSTSDKVFGSIKNRMDSTIERIFTNGFDNIGGELKKLYSDISGTLGREVYSQGLRTVIPSLGSNSDSGGFANLFGGASPRNFFENIFSSVLSGGRANGGAVATGRAYKVGEHGPEFFMPSQAGSIMPSNLSRNINVNIASTGGERNPARPSLGQINAEMAASIRRYSSYL